MADLDLWSLFWGAFLAATLLPGGSEAVLAVVAHQGERGWGLLLAVASVGNTLGAMSSWLIGRLLPQRADHSPNAASAIARIRRFGSPVLLLAWLPFIGDPLCLAAGWLRIHWLPALLFIAIGKTLRYLVVLGLVSSI